MILRGWTITLNTFPNQILQIQIKLFSEHLFFERRDIFEREKLRRHTERRDVDSIYYCTFVYGGGGSVSHSLFLESNFPNHIIRIGSESNSPNNISPNQISRIRSEYRFSKQRFPKTFSESNVLGNTFFEDEWIYERNNHERTTRRAAEEQIVYTIVIYIWATAHNNISQKFFSQSISQKHFFRINLSKNFFFRIGFLQLSKNFLRIKFSKNFFSNQIRMRQPPRKEKLFPLLRESIP